jgi:RHS repeat-associated protein
MLGIEVGLTHLGAREYDPATGRFISPDPILNSGDPQQLGGYRYAASNPTTAADPGGLNMSFCPDGDCRPNAPGYVNQPCICKPPPPPPDKKCGWNVFCAVKHLFGKIGDDVNCAKSWTCPKKNPDTNGDGSTTAGDVVEQHWLDQCGQMPSAQGAAVCAAAGAGVAATTDIYADSVTPARSLANAANNIRSAGVYRGRGTWRRSTASWWRSTAISTASAFGVGPQPSTPRTRRTITNATVRATTPASLPHYISAGQRPRPDAATHTLLFDDHVHEPETLCD